MAFWSATVIINCRLDRLDKIISKYQSKKSQKILATQLHLDKMSSKYKNLSGRNKPGKMSAKQKVKHILAELKGHAPFTLLGAFLGITFMLFFRNIPEKNTHLLFAFFHPLHVVLSAMVTASMFELHISKRKILLIFAVAYIGSIGTATVSDIVMPHIGAELFGIDIPTESQIHGHSDSEGSTADDHNSGSQTQHSEHSRRMHFGFIEEWYLVNPAAVLGILIAWFLPRTKVPHSLHILISTWASSAYLLMTFGNSTSMAAVLSFFVILFLSVWLPCCFSDIVFPLLFVKSDIELTGSCPEHIRHSHPHLQKQSEDQQ